MGSAYGCVHTLQPLLEKASLEPPGNLSVEVMVMVIAMVMMALKLVLVTVITAAVRLYLKPITERRCVCRYRDFVTIAVASHH